MPNVKKVGPAVQDRSHAQDYNLRRAIVPEIEYPCTWKFTAHLAKAKWFEL